GGRWQVGRRRGSPPIRMEPIPIAERTRRGAGRSARGPSSHRGPDTPLSLSSRDAVQSSSVPFLLLSDQPDGRGRPLLQNRHNPTAITRTSAVRVPSPDSGGAWGFAQKSEVRGQRPEVRKTRPLPDL